MKERNLKSIYKGYETSDGAGVKLFRIFGGTQDAIHFDPFLMLDHFGSDNPDDYMAGFPPHPHRGIETVTYMLEGHMEHRDSIGSHGVLRSGDVQWMTAGSGIIHAEMPRRIEGKMEGFQLWVNLPKNEKMKSPLYQDMPAKDIPVVKENNYEIKILCGKWKGQEGAVKGVAGSPSYFDFKISPDAEIEIPVPEENTVFAYVFEGEAKISGEKLGSKELGLFHNGEIIKIQSGKSGVRFILLSGKPLRDPIAWAGPIVMNTREELENAFNELNNGTFIK